MAVEEGERLKSRIEDAREEGIGIEGSRGDGGLKSQIENAWEKRIRRGRCREEEKLISQIQTLGDDVWGKRVEAGGED